jgi:transcriptional regulator with XRE-family HTH domain
MGSTPFYHSTTTSPDWDPNTQYPPERVRLNIGRRIQEKLHELGWRQAELAEKSGLGRDSISLYVRGKNTPSARSLKALADALGCSTEDLAPELEAATKTRIPDYEPAAFTMLADGVWRVKLDRTVDRATMTRIVDALERYDAERKGLNAA